jgi:hypothetical protein
MGNRAAAVTGAKTSSLLYVFGHTVLEVHVHVLQALGVAAAVDDS